MNYQTSPNQVLASLAPKGLDDATLELIEDVLGNSTVVGEVLDDAADLASVGSNTNVLAINLSGDDAQTINFKDLPKSAREGLELVVFGDGVGVVASLFRGFSGVVVLGEAPEGSGNILRVGKGSQHVEGGIGEDSIRTGRGGDTVVTGAGDDTVRAGRGRDSVKVSGADSERNGDGDSEITVFGGRGKDTLDLTEVRIDSVSQSGDFVVIRLIDGRSLQVKSVEFVVYDDDANAGTPFVTVGIKDLLDDSGAT